LRFPVTEQRAVSRPLLPVYPAGTADSFNSFVAGSRGISR